MKTRRGRNHMGASGGPWNPLQLYVARCSAVAVAKTLAALIFKAIIRATGVVVDVRSVEDSDDVFVRTTNQILGFERRANYRNAVERG